MATRKDKQMTTLDKMLQGLANALGASLSTLTTTAKTIVGAINEIKGVVGSGTLTTTNQTLIGAVNELKAASEVSDSIYDSGYVVTTTTHTEQTLFTPTKTGPCIILAHFADASVQSFTLTSGMSKHFSDYLGGGSSYIHTGNVVKNTPVKADVYKSYGSTTIGITYYYFVI